MFAMQAMFDFVLIQFITFFASFLYQGRVLREGVGNEDGNKPPRYFIFNLM